MLNLDTWIEYKDQIVSDFIEKEMQRCREETLRKISNLIEHPKYVENFALCLAYSWFDSEEYAKKIADDLDLGKLEFLAIQEEIKPFKECYVKELEYTVNFY